MLKTLKSLYLRAVYDIFGPLGKFCMSDVGALEASYKIPPTIV